MKSLLATTILLSSLASAESTKVPINMVCIPQDQSVAGMTAKYNEYEVFSADSFIELADGEETVVAGKISFFFNPIEKTYSLSFATETPDGVYECFQSVGTDLKMMSGLRL